MVKSSLRAIGMAALLMPGAVVVASAPASAKWSDCANNSVCLWGNNTYKGAPWFEKSATGSYNTGWANNDETSSVANRSGSNSVYLYNDTNQASTHGVVCLPREYAAADLNDEDPEFDDRISSLKIFTGACSSLIDSIGYKKLS